MASPKSIKTKLTKKNLAPRPKKLATKNFQKFMFNMPLAIVNTLYGIGVNAEKNTAIDPYLLYIFSTFSNCSCLFLKRKLKTGLPPKKPIKYPTAPPSAEAIVQTVAYHIAFSGFAKSIEISKMSGGGTRKKLSINEFNAKPETPKVWKKRFI